MIISGECALSRPNSVVGPSKSQAGFYALLRFKIARERLKGMASNTSLNNAGERSFRIDLIPQKNSSIIFLINCLMCIIPEVSERNMSVLNEEMSRITKKVMKEIRVAHPSVLDTRSYSSCLEYIPNNYARLAPV